MARPLNLLTSFIFLYDNQHANPVQTTYSYTPPTRNYDFDQRFAEGKLPPMTPRFTYSRQEMYSRDFEW